MEKLVIESSRTFKFSIENKQNNITLMFVRTFEVLHYVELFKDY